MVRLAGGEAIGRGESMGGRDTRTHAGSCLTQGARKRPGLPFLSVRLGKPRASKRAQQSWDYNSERSLTGVRGFRLFIFSEL